MPTATPNWRPLNVAIIGGGIGGLAAAIALRREGHSCTIYERRAAAGEVGASLSCAANGARWLKAWGIDTAAGKPVTLLKLTMREWQSGTVRAEYDLHSYEEEWGCEYAMYHRQDMHAMLLDAATSPDGAGPPAKLLAGYALVSLDAAAGRASFSNGESISADIVIGSDGIRSQVRTALGIVPNTRPAPQTCYRCNVARDEVEALGLAWANDSAIQFWGGYPGVPGLSQYYKIVMSPCAGGEILSFYCFMPTEQSKHHEEGFTWGEASIDNILAGAYDTLDPNVVTLLRASIERRPWVLFVHQPYPFWSQGRVTLLGDAAHPMMPHQSQGACQALEDAAALGLIFSRKHAKAGLTANVAKGLTLYEEVRKPRATRVQDASARALEDLNERIGFSSLVPDAPSGRKDKLTVAEMNCYDMAADIDGRVAALVHAASAV